MIAVLTVAFAACTDPAARVTAVPRAAELAPFAPVLGEGRAVDDPVLVAEFSAQQRPAIACAPDGACLVVYTDHAIGPPGGDVMAVRLDAAGQPVERRGFPVAKAAAADTQPAVAWNGAAFQVGWSSRERTSGTTSVRAARVGRDGKLLDAAAVLVADKTGGDSDPSVASDGAQTLVVWTHRLGLGNGQIQARRLAADGQPVGPAFAVSSAGWSRSTPTAAYDGASFWVAWVGLEGTAGSTDEIRAARVSSAGLVLDPAAGIRVAGGDRGQYRPRLACRAANRECLVAWTALPSTGTESVYAARLASDGRVLDSPARRLTQAPSGIEHQNVHLASDGAGYLLAFQVGADGAEPGTGELGGLRLGPDGAALDPTARTLVAGGRTQVFPAAAFDGTQYRLAWEDGRVAAVSIAPDVFTARVSSAGATLDASGVLVSRADNEQSAPSIAAGLGGFLVAWQDERRQTEKDPRSVFVRMFAADGTPRWPARELVPGQVAASPAVAFDGARFFVTHAGAGFLVDGDGNLTRTDPVDTSSPSGPQRVAFDGVDFVILSANYGVSFQRVSTSGRLVDPQPVKILEGGGSEGNPSIACRPSAGPDRVCLAFWSNDVRFAAARIGAGRPLDATPLLVGTASVAPVRTSVAFGDGIFVAASNGMGPRRIGVDGRMLGDAVQVTGEIVAFDGSRFVLADVSSRYEGGFNTENWRGDDVLLTWLAADGSHGAATAPVASDAEGKSALALASDGTGRLLLGYERSPRRDTWDWHLAVRALAEPGAPFPAASRDGSAGSGAEGGAPGAAADAGARGDGAEPARPDTATSRDGGGSGAGDTAGSGGSATAPGGTSALDGAAGAGGSVGGAGAGGSGGVGGGRSARSAGGCGCTIGDARWAGAAELAWSTVVVAVVLRGRRRQRHSMSAVQARLRA